VLIADLARLLFITSLFAALVSFHNAAARYFFSLGREEVLPRRLGAVRRHSGAPYAGSLAQTAIAVVVTAAFAIAGTGSPLGDLYPVLTMFTWLTNDGAMGLVLLMTVVSLAVIGFFRKDKRDTGAWTRLIAPGLGFVLLAAVFVMIALNFNVLLGQEGNNPLTFILPAMIVVPGLAGVAWALRLKRTRPPVYRRIGHGEEGTAAVHLGDEED
jgi:amino acid transporter